MAVPKKKTSYSKRNMRRSHDHLVVKNVVTCPQCKSHKLPHHLCPSCGHYKGRAVLSVSSTQSAGATPHQH